MPIERRVRFDFEVELLNGGGVQGQEFRLDIEGDEIDDEALADAIVRDLRLRMVGPVRIMRKEIIEERHERRPGEAPSVQAPGRSPRFVDVSHVIESGMITYRGLPAPLVCDFLSREASRSYYAEGTEFHIGRIEMVANTGTYLDSPFHRYADGKDVSQLELDSLAELPGVAVRARGQEGRAIDRDVFAGVDVGGRAVLVQTGWDVHWRTDRYLDGHPFLTEDAAHFLRDAGAALVGIDSLNVDDTATGHRPVHTTLLAAGIPIVEHLRGLDQLPTSGFRFSAVPVKVAGMGTFPVRAYAAIDG
jgi:arylformamidase